MIVIVADSSAYLTRAEADSLGVVLAPMSYSVDGRVMYSEGYVGENGDFEKLIAKNAGAMHTSQVTLSSYMSLFDDLLCAGHQILCLTISSRLSGTYANARMAARDAGEDKIEVVDTLTTGAGLYMLVREARACMEAGMTLKDTAARLKERRERVQTYFSVDDMTALRRSGRLGNVRLSVSTILNIKPLLKFDNGGIVSSGITRGRLEQTRALIDSVGDYSGEIIVSSFMADARAGQVMAQLATSGKKATMRSVGPVLGIHLGCGCVGIAWMK